MVEITDELEDWSDLEKTFPKDRGLLIGNGASIALWPKFGYASLYDLAKDTTKPYYLTEREVKLFTDFDTQNFELVLSAMSTAGKVWNLYDKPKEDINDLRDSYKRVQDSLIGAVNEVHVRYERVTEELKEYLKQVFAEYSYIYSTNYDLLLYWSMMTDLK